jgi:hypothetical protein
MQFKKTLFENFAFLVFLMKILILNSKICPEKAFVVSYVRITTSYIKDVFL